MGSWKNSRKKKKKKHKTENSAGAKKSSFFIFFSTELVQKRVLFSFFFPNAKMANLCVLFRALGDKRQIWTCLQKLPRFSRPMRKWRIHVCYFGHLGTQK